MEAAAGCATVTSAETPVIQEQPPKSQWEVLVLRTPKELVPFVEERDKLSAAPLEPNVFYEPWMLLPALTYYADEQQVRMVLIVETDARRTKHLRGLFPIEFSRSVLGSSRLTARLWRYPHCFLTTPLIAPDCAEHCWELLFQWFARNDVLLLATNRLASDGPVFAALAEYRRRHHLPMELRDVYPRALLRLADDAEEYFRTYLGKSSRHEFGRKRRRLADQGRLEIAVLSKEESPDPWLEEFLALEASGWKGQSQTALRCSEIDRRYFHEIIREAHRRNRLQFLIIRVNGKAVAGNFDLYAGEGAFQIKTAYDENWRQFSPGMLAYVETVRLFHAERRCQWVDSCVAALNTSARQVSKQHRMISDVALPVGRLGELLVAATPLGRYCNQLRARILGHLPWKHLMLLFISGLAMLGDCCGVTDGSVLAWAEA